MGFEGIEIQFEVTHDRSLTQNLQKVLLDYLRSWVNLARDDSFFYKSEQSRVGNANRNDIVKHYEKAIRMVKKSIGNRISKLLGL